MKEDLGVGGGERCREPYLKTLMLSQFGVSQWESWRYCFIGHLEFYDGRKVEYKYNKFTNKNIFPGAWKNNIKLALEYSSSF